jgi:DNA-directed RNA polymerase specialized sigma24 family protein
MITLMNNARRTEQALPRPVESECLVEIRSRLLRQARGGAQDMEADHFEQIVALHYEPLFRFALSLTRTEADARDLTQHAFYVWAGKGYQLRDRSKVKAWLFTTLHRAFLAD